MNKYIKLYIFSIFVAFSFIACDTMDTKPFTSFDDDMVWGNKATADGFVLNTYNSTVALFSKQYATLESYTPNGIHSDLSNLDGFPTETTIDRFTNMGFGYFGNLRACNQIIEKTAASEGINESQKKELIAEGHFLRGLVYFKHALWTGRFVPVQKVLASDDKEAFATPLTSSVGESYEYILNDFNEAIKGLPETSLPGRVNKYAALAFKSRACLQAYAYTKEEKYLNEAISSAEAVVSSGKYSLDSDYEGLFINRGSKSNEIILAQYYSDLNTYVYNFNEMINAVPNINNDEIKASKASPLLKDANGRTFEGWASFFPTQDLVDQYLVIDKLDNKAKAWYETSQYLNSVEEKSTSTLKVGDFANVIHKVPEESDLGSNAKGNKIIRYGVVKDNSKINEIMYNNRDKRFYGTIVYDSCQWLGETVTTCCYGNLWAAVRDKGQSDSWYTTASNYYWRKAVLDNVQPRLFYNNKINHHMVLARLGEMHMNLAEAYLLKGDVAKAVKAINETRVKHGALPPSTATTEAEAWKDYIRERRVEMGYEGDIYWSYLRWGKYGGHANHGKAPNDVIVDLDKPVHKIQITKDRKEFFVGQITRNNAWNRNFTVKRYLMPIPQGQIDKRSASGIKDTQNPGW